jgi:transcriptional regulator with XRE-family HTH domain
MEQTINQRLKILRQHLGLSQEEMGKAIGMLQATISGIEVGRQVLTPQNMDLVHKKFKVSKSWLIEGKGEMFEASNKSVATAPNSKEAPDWKDEAYTEIKTKNSLLENQLKMANDELNRVWAMLNHVTGGKITGLTGFPAPIKEAAASLYPLNIKGKRTALMGQA